ncbi:hypothetical protein GMA13_09070 [Ruminococcus sp. zg-924]|nr:hypothetical protein [Ruminococcus sp. zg-924]MCQ4115078.1 hypothetical protein [Ruminococcus sp. zg-921]
MKFKLFKTPVYLSFPLAAMLCIVLCVDSSMTAFCALINAVLHELGHIAVLRFYGCKIKSITLSMFDINIKKTECAVSINSEIAVALSGAAANILFSLLFGVLYFCFDLYILRILSLSAVCLACFNLLPVDSLDGGCALMLFMMKRLDLNKASMILNIISALVIIPMAVCGIILLLISKYNFTLLFTSCYLIGIILIKKKRITEMIG